MDKISMIILNYNDSYTTLSLVDEVRDYECLDSVVVVDNHSSDDSWKRLQTLNGSGKVHRAQAGAKRRLRYGKPGGNQLRRKLSGGRLCNYCQPGHSCVPRCIRRVKDALDKTQGAVAASARVKDPMGENCFLTGPSFLCGRICWIQDWLPGGCLRPC